MHLSTPTFLSLLLLIGTSNVAAQYSINQIIGTQGCVDNTGFAKCMSDSVSKENDCRANASSSSDKSECGCVGSVERLNCFGASCWNKIYSCEYQALVALYLACPLASFEDSIPFWPSPTNATGGCSCNTGQVAMAVYTATNHTVQCVKDSAKASLKGLADKTLACGCCTASEAFSAVANICPDTDPTLIGLSNSTSQLTSKFSWDTCTPSLENFDCVKDFSFAPPPAGGKLYKPSDLPSPGTKTISNTPGQITAPVNATYTWSAAGKQWNVTALNSLGSPVVANATGSSASASASAKSAGVRLEVAWVCALAVVAVMGALV